MDARRRTALAVVATAAAMLGMAYAAVPLYALFCKVTGYGGTTQVATTAPAQRGTRAFLVRFDANVGPGLPWIFEPEERQRRVVTGETVTVFYKVHNPAPYATAGIASYNVAPDQAGSWFNKIACFCFSEQHLAPGETLEMPVVFYLDPALDTDPMMRAVPEVTLSYTFFPAKPKPAEKPRS